MTPPAFIPPADKRQKQCIIDIGNLAIDGSSLGARHEAAQAAVHIALKLGHRVLSLGGGHDYGFPDALASAKQAEASGHRPLLINFDAHLDVRPIENGLTSGTPFFRLLEAKPATELIEIGLQAQCNSPFHFEWLKAHGGTACFEEERSASQSSLLDALAAKLGDRALKRRPAFLSVDIDVFSSAVAPGASQSWPTGIRPDEFFPAFQWCLGRFDVPHVGIYEVSPVLDIDDRTSRLAALIAYRFMFQLFS